MKISLLPFPLWLLFLAVLATTGCSDDDDMRPPESIAATLQADSRFTVLTDALDRTGLTDQFTEASSEHTLFAPNDDAFQRLLNELLLNDLNELENELTTAGLRNILLYHVLGRKVNSDEVVTGYATTQALNTNGEAFSLFTRSSGGVTLNKGVDVVDADINATNGVIHEVDKVLMPLTIAELVSLNTETYSFLTAALDAADGDLAALLSDAATTYTVFAPDNNAFETSFQATGSSDIPSFATNVGGSAILGNILLYHIIPGNLRAESLSNDTLSTAFAGNSIRVDVGSTVNLTDNKGGLSTLTETNIQGTNGVVHRISMILVP